MNAARCTRSEGLLVNVCGWWSGSLAEMLVVFGGQGVEEVLGLDRLDLVPVRERQIVEVNRLAWVNLTHQAEQTADDQAHGEVSSIYATGRRRPREGAAQIDIPLIHRRFLRL